MKAFFKQAIYAIRQKNCRLAKCCLVLFIIFSTSAQAQIRLIPNHGQWPQRVLYSADIPGGIFYVEKDTLTYYFYDAEALHQSFHDHKDVKTISAHVVRVGFPGSAGVKNVVSTGAKSQEYYNYFIGNDPKSWAGKVHATENIVLQEVWKGIDLEITTRGESIKYNFIVHPKADPNLIKIKYSGAEAMYLEKEELKIKTSISQITEKKPFVYQKNTSRSKRNNTESRYAEIDAKFTLQKNILGFEMGKYNRRETLIIDPIIVFSTFSGSVADNFGFTATYNKEGNAFSGGIVYAKGFPTTPGAFQINFQGASELQRLRTDAGILKYSPDGKQLIWATYLGGKKNNEQPHSMVVNSKGELIIFGTTFSSDFPVTANAYDPIYNGGGDIYVCKLQDDGSSLVSSTYIGGSGADGLNAPSVLMYNYGDAYRGEVIVDDQDNVLIASCTQSKDFPATSGTFGATPHDKEEACVIKLKPELDDIYWCSYIGGNEDDAAYGINIDRNGNLLVSGGTFSSDFYTSATAAYSKFLGETDGFVMKISPDGHSIYASTFVGTPEYDQSYFVQVDDNNRIYVTGQTRGDFPVKGNVYSNGFGTQFIAIFENDLSSIYKSTVFGSGRRTVDMSPSAFLVDLCGRIYVSGWGGSVNQDHNPATGHVRGMPLSADAFQKTTDGSDFYLIILAKDLGKIVYASYFGGPRSPEHVDGGTSRFDREGKVYQSVCGGCGGESDFPTTEGAWSRENKGKRPGTNAGGCNNAIFKIDLNSSNYPPAFKDTTLIVTATGELKYNFDIIDSDNTDSIYATFSGKIFDPKQINAPVATLNIQPGIGKIGGMLLWQTSCNHLSADTYMVYIYMRDNGCPTPRTSIGTIKIVVLPPPVPVPPAIFCLERLNEHTLNLQWDEYQTSPYFQNYKLVKRWPNGMEEVVKTFNTKTDNFYTDYSAPGHLTNDYSYFIYGTSICGTIGDSTRTITSIPDPDSIPHAVYMFTVSVENNKALRVIWNKYQNEDFYQYFLYKKENGENKDYKLYKTFRTKDDTSFLDEAVNVNARSYCYKVIVRNQCGLMGHDSFYGCSILLTGESVPFANNLSWNAYKEWKGNVQKYEITRWYSSYPDSVIGETTIAQRKFTDGQLDYDWGIYNYRVTGFEGAGGKGATSISNEIELIQEPIVYVPNAFTPNDDRINDSFNIVPVFVKDYHVKIFNRWGQFVWESNDKKALWNAIYHGRDPFDNVFIWQVEYTGWDRSKHFKNGNVTVLW